MEREKSNVGIIIGVVITIILLVLLILVLTGKIGFSSKKSNDNESGNTPGEYTVKGMTSAKFNLLWDETEREIQVVDGKLKIGNDTYAIPNEKIRYFYYNRYQCSHGTVLYYLTEEGNIYVTDMSTSSNNLSLETFKTFKKLDYSKATDIVAIPNENYGKVIDKTSGMIDGVIEYYYALVNGKTYKLDYQYRC